MGTSHRSEGVRSVVGRIRAGIADLFALPDGYEVLIGNGGSTLFWDAAAFGLIERRSTHVVIGEFSSKFAAVTRAAPHLDDPQVCETPPGERAQLPDHVEGDVYAYPHNETSTGVVVPVHRPTGATRSSSSTARRPRAACASTPTAFDVYYFAPQKCFASDGGLWLACCSPRAIERIERLHASERWMPVDARPRRSRSRTRASTRPTTRPRSRRSSCSTTSSSGCSRNGGHGVRGGPVRRVGGHRSTAGPTPHPHATPVRRATPGRGAT